MQNIQGEQKYITMSMSALDISREAILAMFSSPEEYKKSSKLYKQSIHEGDVRTMLALTENIAQSLNK